MDGGYLRESLAGSQRASLELEHRFLPSPGGIPASCRRDRHQRCNNGSVIPRVTESQLPSSDPLAAYQLSPKVNKRSNCAGSNRSEQTVIASNDIRAELLHSRKWLDGSGTSTEAIGQCVPDSDKLLRMCR